MGAGHRYIPVDTKTFPPTRILCPDNSTDECALAANKPILQQGYRDCFIPVASRKFYVFLAPTVVFMLTGHILIITALLLTALLISAGCTQNPQKLVRLETNMGNITIALAPDMPVTAGNFESLVKKGYYDGVILHRVIDGFMIQGGDPTGTGRSGPGYVIKDEFTNHNRNNRGTISMANAGPDTGGASSSSIS